jgi:hypothetical protein
VILFVAVETGAAAYLYPLWQRWLSCSPAPPFRVLAGPAAARFIAKQESSRSIHYQVADSDAIDALLDEQGKPSVLVASASTHPIEFAAINYARRQGIPIGQFIDTWYGYKRRVSSPAGMMIGDRIAVIDDAAVAEAEGEGLPGSLLRSVGQPAWERAPVLPPAPRQKAVFLGAPVERDYGHTLGYTETDAWQLLQEAQRRHPDLVEELIYAPHPDAPIPQPLASGEATEVEASDGLHRAGTVYGMFSSPMVNAFLGGRCVISIQPSAIGTDMCALSRHGRIARARDYRELIKAVQGTASTPSSLKLELAGSCERLEQFILSLAA